MIEQVTWNKSSLFLISEEYILKHRNITTINYVY